MAQFFTDFTEYTVDQSPHDWTERFAGGAGIVRGSNLPSGATNGRALEATTLRYSWDKPGTPSGDVEVVAKLLHTSPEGNAFRVFLHGAEGAGSPPSSNYYWTGKGTVAGLPQVLSKFVDNTGSTLDTAAFTHNANTWYIVRLQRTGTTIRAKIWQSDSPEPESWLLSSTDTSLSSGFVGMFNLSPGTQWCDWFGVGTDGDPAPMAPVGMTQLYTSFSDNPTLTEHWHTGDGSFSIETSGLPSGATGGAALKVVTTADERYAIAWEEAGTPTGDVELLIKWQVDATSSGNLTGTARGIICGAGDSTSETGYFLDHRVTETSVEQLLAKYDAAAGTILGSALQSLSTNTWYRTRIQKTGTTIRARTWVDSDAEPGTWQVSAADTALSGGWVGIGQAHSSQTLWVDFIGVGTGGDAAPEPVGEPQELAGTAAAASDAEAALTLGLNLSGATAGASAVDDATLTLGLNLSGAVAGASDASATLTLGLNLSGATAGASAVDDATLALGLNLSGSAAGVSTASGTLIVPDIQSLSGAGGIGVPLLYRARVAARRR